jgi:hypothetical protein
MVSGDAEGIVAFSISGFKDDASNTGVTITATTDGSSVTFDKTVPTLSPVTIASNNTNPAYAKAGNVVTLSFTASEAVGTPVVTIATHAATVTPGAGNSYTATWTMTNSDMEGAVPFTINFSDLAGNSGTQVSTTTNASSVTFDRTAPVVNNCPTTNPGFNAGSNCMATVNWTVPSATDNISGALSYTSHTGPNPGNSLTVGSYPVTYVFKDAAGNESTCSFTVTVQDNTGPSFTTNLSASPQVLWPPDHKLKDIVLAYTTTDNCSAVTNNITVTSTDPISGVSDGDKFPDWIVVNDHLVQLRAERGNGREARVYTITVTPVDASGNAGTPQSVYVTIAHNITAPLTGTPFLVGSTVNFAGVFWDRAGSKHTAQWLIDGTTSVKATLTEPSGTRNGKVTGSYKFTTTGIYKLQMNITDQAKVTSYCNTNEDQEAIVVIYDPNGGYTYGGGWFASPPGALMSDPTATGKGNFGFTVNYYKNATLPKGETQFEFKVGTLEYNALNFEYLSIAGYKAVFKGSGKIIGGQSGISFTMYVIDGALDGSGVDKVRLRIYNKNTAQLYYDNEPGKSDAANPTTPVGAGSGHWWDAGSTAYNPESGKRECHQGGTTPATAGLSEPDDPPVYGATEGRHC